MSATKPANETKSYRETTASKRRSIASLLWLAVIFLCPALGFGQTASFTYQGRLSDGGAAANGTYDMQFKLFDTVNVGAGNQIGSTITNGAVLVSSGVFTVQLDYGAAAFSGADRYLEIGMRLAGDANPYTILSPRQQLTSAVYAIRAGSASTADTATTATTATTASNATNATNATTATNATQLGGVAANQYVQTNDSRLADARTPTAGSSNYIQNTAALQAASNFNISGNGTAGGTLSASAINAATQYNIGGNRVLSVAGTDNTFAGVSAGAANTAGAANSFFGASAGVTNTTGFSNAFFGVSAGSFNTTGHDNSFFGVSAGTANTTGFDNSFFGRFAGRFNTTGKNNSFFGRETGLANTTGFDNSFFGRSAGSANSSGSNNSFFGSSAGLSNQASDNSFFGSNAGDSNTTGFDNSFFGSSAGNANTTGGFNAFFGNEAGNSNKLGGDNSFFGYRAGYANTTGGNSFFGNHAGYANTTGGNNSFFGREAGNGNTTGSNNTAIGDSADLATGSLTNATAIGARAFVSQSNSLVLGSINGVNGATADTSVGIGTTVPNARLHIATTGGNIVMGSAGCSSAYAGIGFGASLSGCANYSLLGNGTNTIINRPTGGVIQFRENNAAQMTIAAGGGLTIPGTLAVYGTQVGGDNSLCWNSGTFQIAQCSSSLRYKDHIVSFTKGLDLLNRLRPITFAWKSSGVRDLGFGAEDVAGVEPLLVTRNDKGEVEGVKYDRITAVLVNAVKEQQEQIKRQRNEIASLKALVCRRHRRAVICK
jgi:hypothetical protein